MNTNKNTALPRKDLINKLSKLSSLYTHLMELENKMDDYQPEDNYERKIVVPDFPSQDTKNILQDYVCHKDDDATKKMEAAYEHFYLPVRPSKPQHKKFTTKVDSAYKHTKGSFGWILFIGSLFGFYFWKIKCAKDKDKAEFMMLKKYHEEEIAEKDAQYDKALSLYNSEYEQYKNSKPTFMKDYVEWRNIYLKHLEEEDTIEEKIESDRKNSVQEIYEKQYLPNKEKLDALNDLMPYDYLYAIPAFIELLETHRASDLKEAMSLYDEYMYRKEQLTLLREQEEQRRYEEEQRRADEERRHEEEMRFQREQARQRQQEAEQLRADEERRYKESKQQELQRQRAEKNESKKNCHWCNNWSNCALRHNPPLHCTGFRPGSKYQI